MGWWRGRVDHLVLGYPLVLRSRTKTTAQGQKGGQVDEVRQDVPSRCTYPTEQHTTRALCTSPRNSPINIPTQCGLGTCQVVILLPQKNSHPCYSQAVELSPTECLWLWDRVADRNSEWVRYDEIRLGLCKSPLSLEQGRRLCVNLGQAGGWQTGSLGMPEGRTWSCDHHEIRLPGDVKE
ncbi:hypothetical protein Bbelb_061860 [Branchiostoma belcheri]|nr:hypothetical protein Bbelb_061860 [Branchiostoma belcheri]